MIDLPRGRVSFFPSALLRIMRLTGQGSNYIPGGNSELVGLAPFIGNPVTSDPVRHARNAAILEEDPTLGIAAPTVDALYALVRAADRRNRGEMPVISGQ